MSPRLAVDAPPIYERYQKYLLQRGVKRRVEGERLRRPSRGMSSTTVAGRLDYVLRLHTDLAYLAREERGASVRDRFTGIRGKDPQKMSVREVLAYMHRRFPAEKRGLAADVVHDSYATAARSWAEFCHFETGTWSEEKVLDLYERLPFRVQRKNYPEIDIEPTERVDPWVLWLRDGYGDTVDVLGRKLNDRFPLLARKLFTVATLGGHCGGMRIAEILHAPWRLDGRTLRVEDGTATIWGKGGDAGTLSKERKAPWFPHVAEAVARWKEAVSANPEVLAAHERHNRLFLNDRDEAYNSERSLSRTLQFAAARYNEVVLKARGERPLDLRKIRTHAIGRHRFGTYWANLPSTKRPADSGIMGWMGIEDHKVFRRYVNADRREEARKWGDVADPSSDVQSGPAPAQEPTNGAVLERMDSLVRTVEDLSRQLQEERDRSRELTDRLLSEGKTRPRRRLPG